MSIAGKGSRRPLLDINIKSILLDRDNPRLIPYLPKEKTINQEGLIKVLYQHFDSENVGLSLVQNGYFDEEPIIVIPQNLPSDFNYDDYANVDELTKAYKELIDAEQITFIVVEGNRRVSAIKLITDFNIRQNLGLDAIFPSSNDEYVFSDISNIPAMIYPVCEDVFTYLGIGHIAGDLKWEAFAQASYTANMIDHYTEQNSNVNTAIKEVQKVIAHRSDKLVKQYVSYKLFKQAQEDLEFDVRPIINKFSLLTVAYNSGSIRDYLNLPKYKDVNFSADLIHHEKLDEFRNVLTWIYGDTKKNKRRVLTDSRAITSELSHVVKHKEAINHLLETEDLSAAYERTSGEKEFLKNKIKSATKSLQTSLRFAYKYKNDDDLIENVNELKEVLKALELQIND